MRSSVPDRPRGSGTAAMPPMGLGTKSWPPCWQRPMLPEKSHGRFRWIPRSAVLISTAPTPSVRISPQGARSNHKNPKIHEPEGHAVGRSHGGLSSKLHAAVDANAMPLAIVLTGGQRNDGAVFTEVIDDIRVPRLSAGRPRTRPDAVIADMVYSNGIIRDYLSARGIRAVIPQKSNEKNSRKNKGSTGGRPQPPMPGSIRAATSWNGSSAWPSNGEASPPGTRSSRSPTGPPQCSARCWRGYANRRHALVLGAMRHECPDALVHRISAPKTPRRPRPLYDHFSP